MKRKGRSYKERKGVERHERERETTQRKRRNRMKGNSETNGERK